MTVCRSDCKMRMYVLKQRLHTQPCMDGMFDLYVRLASCEDIHVTLACLFIRFCDYTFVLRCVYAREPLTVRVYVTGPRVHVSLTCARVYMGFSHGAALAECRPDTGAQVGAALTSLTRPECVANEFNEATALAVLDSQA